MSEITAVERVVTSPPATPDTRAAFNLVLSNGSRVLLGVQIVSDTRFGRAKVVAVSAQERRSAFALASALGLTVTDG